MRARQGSHNLAAAGGGTLHRVGAIEAGGTKFVCGLGTGPHDLETIRIPTTSPEATVGRAVDFFRSAGGVDAVGIASFGPLDLRAGRITATPKEGWRNFDLAGCVSGALGTPVALDTDVNGAAIGEARWGAARGLTDFIYLTVGTGIGGGAMTSGRILHGLLHPEMGHIRIPHDHTRDPYPGICPYHGDCLEGLASGPAIEQRWGAPAEDLSPDHPAWELEAQYLALGLANWVCTLSPQRIILGGGVMRRERLFDPVRAQLARLINGYIPLPGNDFVVPPQLGERAGVLGALALGFDLLGSRYTP